MPVVIKSKSLTLREMKKSDAKSLYENANNYGIYRYTLRIPNPYTIEHAKEFIEKSGRQMASGKSYALGIELRSTKKVIGVISVEPRDWDDRTAELGYWIGRAYWNQGIGTEAVGKMADFCFNNLGLDHLYAKVIEPNVGSLRVLEKCGFRRDNEHRGSVLKDGMKYVELKFDLYRNGGLRRV